MRERGFVGGLEGGVDLMVGGVGEVEREGGGGLSGVWGRIGEVVWGGWERVMWEGWEKVGNGYVGDIVNVGGLDGRCELMIMLRGGGKWVWKLGVWGGERRGWGRLGRRGIG